MESSKVPGDSEECCSSESGWTTYIGSPVDDNNDDDDDHSTDKTVDKDEKDEDEDGSDDSMASDASSGPSHRGLPYGSSKGSRVSGNSKHSESQDQSKFPSGKKQYKQVEKKVNEKRIKGEKEVTGHNANSGGAASYGQSEPKVKKTTKKKKNRKDFNVPFDIVQDCLHCFVYLVPRYRKGCKEEGLIMLWS